jgi:hypothetical protein
MEDELLGRQSAFDEAERAVPDDRRRRLPIRFEWLAAA